MHSWLSGRRWHMCVCAGVGVCMCVDDFCHCDRRRQWVTHTMTLALRSAIGLVGVSQVLYWLLLLLV